MKTKVVIVLVLAALVGGGVYVSQYRNASTLKENAMEKTENNETTGDSMMKKDGSAPQSDTALNDTQSRYVAYSSAAFESAKGKKRVYFFFAPWCPTCVPTDKEFKANLQKIPADVMLFKTDYDSSAELKKQYGVTYQHTFVLVDDTGKELKKWNGGGVAELIANTQ